MEEQRRQWWEEEQRRREEQRRQSRAETGAGEQRRAEEQRRQLRAETGAGEQRRTKTDDRQERREGWIAGTRAWATSVSKRSLVFLGLLGLTALYYLAVFWALAHASAFGWAIAAPAVVLGAGILVGTFPFLAGAFDWTSEELIGRLYAGGMVAFAILCLFAGLIPAGVAVLVWDFLTLEGVSDYRLSELAKWRSALALSVVIALLFSLFDPSISELGGFIAGNFVNIRESIVEGWGSWAYGEAWEGYREYHRGVRSAAIVGISFCVHALLLSLLFLGHAVVWLGESTWCRRIKSASEWICERVLLGIKAVWGWIMRAWK